MTGVPNSTFSEKDSLGTVTGSVLFSTLEQLTASRTLRLKLDNPICVAVIAIDRYLGDQQKTDGCVDSYKYDVTVTDGKFRAKCFLAVTLNHLVHKNSLRCGTDVQISQLSFIYDERRLGQSFVCLETIDCTAQHSTILPTIKDLSALRQWSRTDGGSSMLLQVDAPLQTDRKHYLSLWNNEDPHGRRWVPHSPPPDVVIDVSKISLLGDLDSFFANSKRPLPLLVRVLHKSRLRYYGKPGQKIDFPYQAYFEVADQSGIMTMVLWNDLCLEWYQRLTIGTVVYLQQFALKRSYQNRSRPQHNQTQLMHFHSTEISLNPHSPPAIVTVIPPKRVLPEWCLPEVAFNFTTRSEVENLASNQACDIIGLVTFVGRVERIKNKGNAVPEKYWTYRWVHAVDGTFDTPFILEIFSSSQPDIFNNIAPMTYLVCTQMRVCREAGFPLYLTSSSETQLFVTGCHKRQPYVNTPKVKAFIQWTKTLKDMAVLRKTAVGGYYCYPPAPPTFSTSSDNAGTQIPVVALADLKEGLKSLCYREHKRLAIQGQIVAVQYHSRPEEASQAQERTTPHEQQQSRSVDVSSRTDFAPPSHPEDTGLVEQSELPSLKRRRIQHERSVASIACQCEDEEDEDNERHGEEEGLVQTSVTEAVADPPRGLWESDAWVLLKQNVTEHLRCGRLERESIPERFRFDNRDLLLQRVNLQPVRWNPEFICHTEAESHIPVDCKGYFTLTVLGLNQQMAVDVLFVPVVCADDPRAVGMPSALHDNSILSCLSAGRLCTPPGNSCPSLEGLLNSAATLDGERVVCVLDLCLLGDGRAEQICSKVYRMADINLA
ncbi:RPA-related protein RADX [Chanos chanos]|uniref:RPA-related protein RADX n=1 Tax=Chanos chanos TaxID=29144 RepID=A0A6J2W3X2_CHACN|nr:RPA-related protein RADX-like [Chanos chanos]